MLVFARAATRDWAPRVVCEHLYHSPLPAIARLAPFCRALPSLGHLHVIAEADAARDSSPARHREDSLEADKGCVVAVDTYANSQTALSCVRGCTARDLSLSDVPVRDPADELALGVPATTGGPGS